MAGPDRVLIVEDEPAVGQVVTDLLVDEGYEVRWARNGRDGLAELQAWRPQLIVLDLMMPAMDGRAFRTAQLQLPPDLAQVPVIVLTGMREGRAAAAALGAIAAITKPFELDDLVQAVRRCLLRSPE